MFSFFLNRWIIVRRFEKADSGYIYRRRSDLPGFEITQDERDEVLREYRRLFWKYSFLNWTVFFVAIVLFALLISFFETSEIFKKILIYALSLGLVASILWQQREWSLLPERKFAGRPHVNPTGPPGGWFVRFQRLSRERTWPKHIIYVALSGSGAWFLIPRSVDAEIMHWFLFVCFAGSLVLLLYGVIFKARRFSD